MTHRSRRCNRTHMPEGFMMDGVSTEGSMTQRHSVTPSHNTRQMCDTRSQHIEKRIIEDMKTGYR